MYSNQLLKGGQQGPYAVFVCNRLHWHASRILRLYLQRWPIETFYRDGKQHLGFAAYQQESMEAIKKHWQLVFVAYSLLHLELLKSPSNRKAYPIETIGDACRDQSAQIVEALLRWRYKRLEKGQSVSGICRFLFAQQGIVTMN